MGVNKDSAALTPCGDCGMPVAAKEYHPYAACLMYKASGDPDTVRANLGSVVAHGVMTEQMHREEEGSQCYALLALELIRPGSLYEGIEQLIERLRKLEYANGKV